MNEIFEVCGEGTWESGIMIVAAKNEDDARIYAVVDGDERINWECAIVRKLWMLGKTEFEGVITKKEFFI